MPQGSTRRAAWATCLFAALLVIALALVLAPADRRLSGVNGIPAAAFTLVLAPRAEACQSGERVPAQTTGLRLIAGTYGRGAQPLEVAVTARGGALRTGTARRYADGGEVVVDLEGATAQAGGARVCVRNTGRGLVALAGAAATPLEVPSGTTRSVMRRLHLAYVLEGERTGLGMMSTIADRFGRAKAGVFGPWTFWLTLVLVIGAAVLALVTLVRSFAIAPGPEGGDPPGGRGSLAAAAAAVGLLNAIAWGLLTPPFHVPDEYKHIAYAQQLAETGRPPPVLETERPSPEQAAALRDTAFNSVVFDPRQKPPWSAGADRALQRDLERPRRRDGRAAAAGASNYPPLYYAGAALAARTADSGTLLDRIAAMRLVSALCVAATAAFVLLFLAEVLPRAPWAWALGGLVAALQPMLGFIGGGVNNDNLLLAAAAAMFWLAARGFRRGVDDRLAAGLGLAAVVGLLAKPTMLALLPGAVAALALGTARGGRGRSRLVVRRVLVFTGTLLAPFLLYALVNALAWERGGPLNAGTIGTGREGGSGSPVGLASYLWQFYLPPLPGMRDWFGELPLWDVWFKGWVGRFGWKDVVFPAWAYGFAAAAGALVLAGLVRVLVRHRGTLRRRRGELAAYATMTLGTLALLHVAGYRWIVVTGTGFEQGRYLLVLLPVYALAVALAARGLGRRGVAWLAPAILVLALANSSFAMIATVARYYV